MPHRRLLRVVLLPFALEATERLTADLDIRAARQAQREDLIRILKHALRLVSPGKVTVIMIHGFARVLSETGRRNGRRPGTIVVNGFAWVVIAAVVVRSRKALLPGGEGSDILVSRSGRVHWR